MAEETVSKHHRPAHVLPRIWYGKGRRLSEQSVYFFDRMCPITGDAIYERTDDKGNTFRLISTNPDAHEHQARMLALGV